MVKQILLTHFGMRFTVRKRGARRIYGIIQGWKMKRQQMRVPVGQQLFPGETILQMKLLSLKIKHSWLEQFYNANSERWIIYLFILVWTPVCIMSAGLK